MNFLFRRSKQKNSQLKETRVSRKKETRKPTSKRGAALISLSMLVLFLCGGATSYLRGRYFSFTRSESVELSVLQGLSPRCVLRSISLHGSRRHSSLHLKPSLTHSAFRKHFSLSASDASINLSCLLSSPSPPPLLPLLCVCPPISPTASLHDFLAEP